MGGDAALPYLGRSTAPKDEGHVRTHGLTLYSRCAAGRIAAQEQVPMFGWPMLG